MITTDKVKFIHHPEYSISFGLCIYKESLWIAVSSAKRDGKKGEDVYSKQTSRQLIVQRFNHFFGYLKKRPYRYNQVLELTDERYTQNETAKCRKRVLQIIDNMLKDPYTKNLLDRNRKRFILSSLQIIQALYQEEILIVDTELIDDMVYSLNDQKKFGESRFLDQEILQEESEMYREIKTNSYI